MILRRSCATAQAGALLCTTLAVLVEERAIRELGAGRLCAAPAGTVAGPGKGQSEAGLSLGVDADVVAGTELEYRGKLGARADAIARKCP
ncbi:hypothetical protein FA95DRAFT_1568168 [Auriscalpium vulgare]|uniref:Uncharacterized protein n=1 Tax=Auriscalpium vulgare TaxID=40419 RepID=A0ACB8R0S3_9AGAM|nr:hypothetical protein FA95DRAFT_1568168 [Auriscalpium vulgare]